MLKRRMLQEEAAADDAEYSMIYGDEMSEESTTDESEMGSDEDMDEMEEEVSSTPAITRKEHSTKNKVLILASRGVNASQRHLMDDLCLLMPHAKKESKFDTKRELHVLNELAELNGCNHILYFEARKPQELFFWACRTPNGPSVRFHVQNINTLDELHLGGNCMKNARPILTFDPVFSESSHLGTMKDVLTSIFGVPSTHRKTRPYIDRVMHFSFTDDRIWIRNYQIIEGTNLEEKDNAVSMEGMTLVEIGPRFILHPIRVMEGSLSGSSLWVNPHYVPAGVLRANMKANEAFKHRQKAQNQETTLLRKKAAVLPEDELEKVFE